MVSTGSSFGRGAALILLALFGASLSSVACRAPQEEPARPAEAGRVDVLDARHEPLRADFDRDAARPRLLVLASPT